MKISSLRLAFIANLALTATGWADTLAYSDSFPVTATNWSTTMSFPQFDPTLGLLTSIRIDMSSSVNGVIAVENADGAATLTLNLSSNVTISRPDLSLLVQVIPISTTTFEATAYDGITDFGGTSGVTTNPLVSFDSSNVTTSSFGDIALFTGVGSISLPISATDVSNVTGTFNLISLFNNGTDANVLVSYNYIPVPEASSYAAIAGALALGVVWIKRRQKRSF